MGLMIHPSVERKVSYADGSGYTPMAAIEWVLKKILAFLTVILVSFDH